MAHKLTTVEEDFRKIGLLVEDECSEVPATESLSLVEEFYQRHLVEGGQRRHNPVVAKAHATRRLGSTREKFQAALSKPKGERKRSEVAGAAAKLSHALKTHSKKAGEPAKEVNREGKKVVKVATKRGVSSFGLRRPGHAAGEAAATAKAEKKRAARLAGAARAGTSTPAERVNPAAHHRKQTGYDPSSGESRRAYDSRMRKAAQADVATDKEAGVAKAKARIAMRRGDRKLPRGKDADED